MPTDSERVERLVIRSRELLIDHFVVRLKLAINCCSIGNRREGDERLPYLRMAQSAYANLQRDSYRQTYSRPEQVVSLLETLRLQLVKLDDGRDQNELRDANTEQSLKGVVRGSKSPEGASPPSGRFAKSKGIDSGQVLDQAKKDELIGEIQDLLELQNFALAHFPLTPADSQEFDHRKSHIRGLIASLVSGRGSSRPKPLTCGCPTLT